MAALTDKSLYEVLQNGTLEQVTEAVDAELKSLGKICDETWLSVLLFQI